MRYIGEIIVIIGALALIIPALAGFQSNVTLIIGVIILIAGAVVHPIVMKKSIDKDLKS